MKGGTQCHFEHVTSHGYDQSETVDSIAPFFRLYTRGVSILSNNESLCPAKLGLDLEVPLFGFFAIMGILLKRLFQNY